MSPLLLDATRVKCTTKNIPGRNIIYMQEQKYYDLTIYYMYDQENVLDQLVNKRNLYNVETVCTHYTGQMCI